MLKEGVLRDAEIKRHNVCIIIFPSFLLSFSILYPDEGRQPPEYAGLKKTTDLEAAG